MGVKNLDIYNLNYSGKFKQIDSAPGVGLFTLYNILAIYVYNKKKMFIWIGKNASNSLKLYIPNIRELFLEEFPDKKILRNITIESGYETMDFLENFDFQKEQLDACILSQEHKITPILSSIKDMKEQVEQLIEMQKYEEAILKSEEIIDLARKIEDKALENDQEFLLERIRELKHKNEIDVISKIDNLRITERNNYRIGNYKEAVINARKIIDLAKAADLYLIIKEEEEFIAKLTGKYNPQQLMIEARERSVSLKTQYNELIEKDEIKEAHELVLIYVEDYGKYCDLLKIPAAKYIIEKDQTLWKEYWSKREKIKAELDELEKQYIQAISMNNIKKAANIFDKAWDLLFSLNDDELIKKWAELEEKYAHSSQQVMKEAKSVLLDEIEGLLKKENRTLNKKQIDDFLPQVSKYIELAKSNNLTEMEARLSRKKEELLTLSQDHVKKEQEVRLLEERLDSAVKYKEFNKAMDICRDIIELAKILNNTGLIDYYLSELEKIQGEETLFIEKETEKKNILQAIEHLKINIQKLNEKGKDSFHDGNLSEALNIYSKIVNLLDEFNNGSRWDKNQ